MTSNKPYFSIIIPALNEAKYLPNLLEDLAQQTYQDFEVIVVDGHSDDQTVAKAKAYAKKLSLTILTSSRRHVCTQRNLGGEKARADWLIFMDADNRLPVYFLQGIKYRLESESSDIATCWLQSDTSAPKDKNIALAINYATELMKNTFNAVCMEAMIITHALVFTKLGGFNEQIHVSEGQELLRRARKLELTFQVFRDPVYTYSFRRIRKYGLINIVSRLSANEVAILIGQKLTKHQVNKLYPMEGGSLFDTRITQQNKDNFTRNINHIFTKVKLNQKPLSLNTLKQQLQHLLEI